MPTYEFRCPNGHEFEKFYRSISGAPIELPCPTCGKIAARQMSAGAGLHFKGSGFYITDYGKDGKKSQTPPPAAGGDKSESGSGTPAAKPDAPSPAKTGEKQATSEPKPAASAKPGKNSKTSE